MGGCGSGSSTSKATPAPTAAPTVPTPDPTPVPTAPPTDAWVTGVCAWHEAPNKETTSDVWHIMEAACDDSKSQLTLSAVSIVKNTPVPLVQTQSCKMATNGFLSSVCGDGKGKITFQNDTFGNCTIYHKDQTLEWATSS